MSGEDNGPERMLHVEDSVAACPLLRIGMRGVFLDHLAGGPPGSYDHLSYESRAAVMSRLGSG